MRKVLCKKRECSAPALPATALTNVSASVLGEDENPISDPATHAKEAEVMPVIGALNTPLNRFLIVSTS